MSVTSACLLVAALFAACAVPARSGLLASLTVVVLFAMLGSSSSYQHAFYELEVRQPLATVLAFSALALGAHIVSRFVAADWERLLTIVARTAALLANLGFWVGSLWGDDLDWLAVSHGSVPVVAFSIAWAACLLAAAVWAGWTNRRRMLNLVAVFAGIHFYTQWFEHLGTTPASVDGGVHPGREPGHALRASPRETALPRLCALPAPGPTSDDGAPLRRPGGDLPGISGDRGLRRDRRGAMRLPVHQGAGVRRGRDGQREPRGLAGGWDQQADPPGSRRGLLKRIGGNRMNLRVTGLVMVAALLSLATGHSRAASDPAQPFAEAWSRLPGSTGWRMLVSAPSPRDWPPVVDGHGMTAVRYAFAMRLNPGLADGAEVGAPWAWSTEAEGGAVTVTSLAAELHPLGIQGVRPLTKAELDLVGREAEAAGLLQAGGTKATDPLVRAATCGWIGRNGVVAAAIAPLHPAFTRWLACGNAGVEPVARPR